MTLAVVGLVTRTPFVGRYLANWDSVQYALGLSQFDVYRHQPHPPGSILYVGLGRLALFIFHDANLALASISVLASVLSLPVCYLLGRRLFGARIGTVAAILFACSPLTWYYGVVALPYALEGALAAAVVLLCWHALDEKSPGAVLASAAVLAVAGGVRQTSMLLLIPLWLYSALMAGANGRPLAEPGSMPSPPPLRALVKRRALRLPALGLTLMAALCLCWLVPLLYLSGGVGRYWAASRQLSTLIGSLSSIFVVGLPGAALNLGYVLNVTFFSLNLAAAVFVVYLLPGVHGPWHPTTAQRLFLLLWAAPALLVFVLIHIGQAGYLLLLWPLACFAAAIALVGVADWAARRWRADRQRVTALATLLAASTSAVLFLLAPLSGQGVVGLGRSAIAENERFWSAVEAETADLPAESTTVLTGSLTTESFRMAQYYLPRYHVYAIGLDRKGALGVLFEAYQGWNDYERFMEGAPALTRIDLPPVTRQLLILDDTTSRLFPSGELRKISVTPNHVIWLWPATPGRSLTALSVPRYVEVERR